MIKKYLADGVPSFFFKFDTDVPFDRCTLCDELLEGKKYIIEKHLKHNKRFGTNEIVYEYAVCEDCTTSMQGDISEESLQSITELFAEHQNQLLMKLEYLHSTEKYNIDSWLEKCSFTGLSTSQCDNFSVSAIIEDGSLVYEQTPMVVSDVFMEKVQDTLSKETKESFDGIKDKIVDGSPSIEDIIGTPTVGII